MRESLIRESLIRLSLHLSPRPESPPHLHLIITTLVSRVSGRLFWVIQYHMGSRGLGARRCPLSFEAILVLICRHLSR